MTATSDLVTLHPRPFEAGFEEGHEAGWNEGYEAGREDRAEVGRIRDEIRQLLNDLQHGCRGLVDRFLMENRHLIGQDDQDRLVRDVRAQRGLLTPQEQMVIRYHLADILEDRA